MRSITIWNRICDVVTMLRPSPPEYSIGGQKTPSRGDGLGPIPVQTCCVSGIVRLFGQCQLARPSELVHQSCGGRSTRKVTASRFKHNAFKFVTPSSTLSPPFHIGWLVAQMMNSCRTISMIPQACVPACLAQIPRSQMGVSVIITPHPPLQSHYR